MTNLNANELREKRTEYFKNNFDFDAFNDFVKKALAEKTILHIGLTPRTKKWARENNRKCELISFCYEWIGAHQTNVQVDWDYTQQIADYLHECGFRIELSGPCGIGYHYNIITISL